MVFINARISSIGRLFHQILQFKYANWSISIQQSFLLFSTSKAGLQEQPVEEALRVRAILYLKAVLEELPSLAIGSRVPVSELKRYIDGKVDPRRQNRF